MVYVANVNGKKATYSGAENDDPIQFLTDRDFNANERAVLKNVVVDYDGISGTVTNAVKINTAQAITANKCFTTVTIHDSEIHLTDISGSSPQSPPSSNTSIGTIRWAVRGASGNTTNYGGGVEFARMQPILYSTGQQSIEFKVFNCGTTNKTHGFTYYQSKDGNSYGITLETSIALTDNSTNVPTTNWVQQHISAVNTSVSNVSTNVTTVSNNVSSLTTRVSTMENADYVKKSECQTVRVVTSEFYSEGQWYRKWSDGWIEQGGTYSHTASLQDKTISLNIAFSNTDYICIATGEVAGASIDNGHIINTVTRLKTTTYFGIIDYDVNGNTNQTNISWYACGY